MVIKNCCLYFLLICISTISFSQPELKEVGITKKGEIHGILIVFDTEFASKVYITGKGELGWIDIIVPGGSIQIKQNGEFTLSKELNSNIIESYPYDADSALAEKVKKAGTLAFDYYPSTSNKNLAGKLNQINDNQNKFDIIVKYFNSDDWSLNGKIDRIYIKKRSSSFDGQIVFKYHPLGSNASMLGKIFEVVDMRDSSHVKGSQKIDYVQGLMSRIVKIIGLNFEKFAFIIDFQNDKIKKIGKAEFSYQNNKIVNFSKQAGIEIKLMEE